MRNVLKSCAWAIFAIGAASGQTTATFSTAASQRAFLNQYCADCHNDQFKSGNMSLDKLNLQHIDQSAELAEKVARKLRVGMMPPPGMPRPNASTVNAFAASLETAIDSVAAARPYSGRPALHRLNRTEYANSVRDLLGVQIDVSALLPPDDMSHGFDNMADVLTISPSLMDGYIRAASRISREAVGDPDALALTTTYSISRVASQNRHVEGTPFGTRGGLAILHNFPADGDYIFKIGYYYAPTGPLFGVNQGKGHQVEIAVNGERVALIDVNPALTLAKDGVKTQPIHIKAGEQRVSASFLTKADGPIEDEFEMVEQTLVDVSAGAVPGVTTLPHLHELSITGPNNVTGISDTASRLKIFTCHPAAQSDETGCAKKIVAGLARQAYRRPVTDRDLEDLLNFYQAGRNLGSFDSGVRTAIQAILASPEFVFRFEKESPGATPGKNFRIGDLELASRLSYFLWSSAPDDALITAASQGKLKDPAVLQQQVRRMLADPRSAALSTKFADQWLHLQNLNDANPDLFIFPNFDKTLAQSMKRESELLFDSVMREDRNVLDLLTADYTFVDERLARHYDIPNVMGGRFRRVPVTDDNRKGLLGHAGILMLTSTAIRTSPVQRGKWVMEVLLGTPPPPPPPNVPALPENSEGRTGHAAKLVSVRERLQQHRADPNCAGCHKLMDPIGFALENFDAVGVWRANDSGILIDPSGEMFDGAKLSGPASLRAAVLKHSDAFLGTFTESLLAYGLGRVIDYRDMPTVRTIDREAAKNSHRFSNYIMGIVNSVPFQMRRAEEPGPPKSDMVAGDPHQ